MGVAFVWGNFTIRSVITIQSQESSLAALRNNCEKNKLNRVRGTYHYAQRFKSCSG